MTCSIEFQMLSKEAASKIKTQMNKISVMKVFNLKTQQTKNGTESKMSDRKN